MTFATSYQPSLLGGVASLTAIAPVAQASATGAAMHATPRTLATEVSCLVS